MSLAGLAMLGSAACWGLATVMSKDLLDHFPPLTLLTIQLSVSVFALWIGAIATGFTTAVRTTDWRLAAAVLLEPGASYIFAISGLAVTGAAQPQDRHVESLGLPAPDFAEVLDDIWASLAPCCVRQRSA